MIKRAIVNIITSILLCVIVVIISPIVIINIIIAIPILIFEYIKGCYSEEKHAEKMHDDIELFLRGQRYDDAEHAW